MVEVIGTVISSNLSLCGFVFKGKASEFGEVGNDKVIRKFTMQDSKKLLQRCSNFDIIGGKIISKTNKKLNELDAYDANVEGQKIDRRIALTSKIVADGDIIGFDVISRHNGKVNRYRYQDVITLCGWMKPENFVVKYNATGKAFISGKPGVMRLAELPSVESITKSGRAKRRKINAVNNPVTNNRQGTIDTKKVDSAMSTTLDIFSIIKAIDEHNGVIIYENDENDYVNTTDTKTKVGDDFVPLGNCLIAKPNLEFSSDKLKVNIKFRKPGIVSVDSQCKVFAFTYSDRTIIKNGVNYIKRIVVGIEPKAVRSLLDYFARCGGDLHISEWENEKLLKQIEAFNGNKGLKYYTVDLSKINVLSRKVVNDWNMSTEDLYKCVEGLIVRQCRIKGLKRVVKLKAPEVDPKQNISPFYSMINPSYLAKLEEIGIDIHTGAYTKRNDLSKKEWKKGSDSSDTPISISYGIKGLSLGSITADDIALGTDKARANKCFDMMLNEFDRNQIMALKYEVAKDELDKLNRECFELKRKIWINNAVMLQKSNYEVAFKGESKKWTETTSKSKSGARKFYCNNLPNLLVSVSGIQVDL